METAKKLGLLSRSSLLRTHYVGSCQTLSRWAKRRRMMLSHQRLQEEMTVADEPPANHSNLSTWVVSSYSSRFNSVVFILCRVHRCSNLLPTLVPLPGLPFSNDLPMISTVTHRSKRGKFQARIYKCNNEYNLGANLSLSSFVRPFLESDRMIFGLWLWRKHRRSNGGAVHHLIQSLDFMRKSHVWLCYQCPQHRSTSTLSL